MFIKNYLIPVRVSVALLIMLCFSIKAEPTLFNVVVGFEKPPYVTEDGNNGFEIELITAVLTSMQLDPQFNHVPFRRSSKMFQNENIDAMMTVNHRIIPDISFLSDNYIYYQNVVVTLKKNQYKLSSVDDLGLISFAAFQSASRLLGDAYSKAVSQSKSYIEVEEPLRQIHLLFEEKVDGLVIDINIFNTLSASFYKNNDVEVHPIFPKSYYRMAFKNKALIQTFNLALVRFKASPEYLNLLNKYNIVQ